MCTSNQGFKNRPYLACKNATGRLMSWCGRQPSFTGHAHSCPWTGPLLSSTGAAMKQQKPKPEGPWPPVGHARAARCWPRCGSLTPHVLPMSCTMKRCLAAYGQLALASAISSEASRCGRSACPCGTLSASIARSCASSPCSRGCSQKAAADSQSGIAPIESAHGLAGCLRMRACMMLLALADPTPATLQACWQHAYAGNAISVLHACGHALGTAHHIQH